MDHLCKVKCKDGLHSLRKYEAEDQLDMCIPKSMKTLPRVAEANEQADSAHEGGLHAGRRTV
jgi:hypothetical protein